MNYTFYTFPNIDRHIKRRQDNGYFGHSIPPFYCKLYNNLFYKTPSEILSIILSAFTPNVVNCLAA